MKQHVATGFPGRSIDPVVAKKRGEVHRGGAHRQKHVLKPVVEFILVVIHEMRFDLRMHRCKGADGRTFIFGQAAGYLRLAMPF